MHDDHLALDAPDEDWIALAGRKGWVALTKDKNIRYRAAELDSVRRHKARIIVIRATGATGSDIAELLVRGRRRIARFAARTAAPYVAGINSSGEVKAYEIS